MFQMKSNASMFASSLPPDPFNRPRAFKPYVLDRVNLGRVTEKIVFSLATAFCNALHVYAVLVRDHDAIAPDDRVCDFSRASVKKIISVSICRKH